MNAPFGHNETAVRLGLLAEDAKHALAQVASAEADTIEGWVAYGAALNEGRALFPIGDNVRFSEWLTNSNLEVVNEKPIHPAERAAAMWAAAYPEQFEEARAAGNARTVRGIYAKWKEMEAFRLAKEMLEDAFVKPSDPIEGPTSGFHGDLSEHDFEEQVESAAPPTLTQLAQQGIQRRDPAPQPDQWLQGRNPKQFNKALHFTALVTEYAADLARSGAVEIIPHLDDGQRMKLRTALRQIDGIHDQIATRI